MSQPLDTGCRCKPLGSVDTSNGQFWVSNPWRFVKEQYNLSCYERNRVYENLGDGGFIDVSWISGGDDEGDSRGIAAADFDNDGMPDLALCQIGGGPLKIFLNRYPKTSYLKVSLRGVASNSLGIGARLTALAGGMEQRRDLMASNTFWAQGPAEVLFGLGDAKRVERLTIRWPSGTTQVLTDIAVDRHIEVLEGSDQIVEIPAVPPVAK